MTDLFFCNLCDQSVPVARLEAGDAVRHGGRVICPTCCDALAMTLKGESSGGKSGNMIVPLFVGLVACAATVFVYLELGEVRKDSTGKVNDAVMSFQGSLNAGQQDSKETLAAFGQQIDQMEIAMGDGFAQGVENVAAVDRRVRSMGSQVEQLEGLADGQATLQQSVRSVQAQLQVTEEGLREVRTGQEFLRDNLADVERKLVVAAAAPPKESGFSSEVQALVDKLKEEDPLQRVAAIEKLSKYEDPALVPFVEALLDDNYEMNRFYAANTLGSWEAMASVPALIETLGDDFAFVRKEANAALVMITKEDMGYDAKGSDRDRQKASERWTEWWKAHSTE
jgi:hypothetical protein